MDASREEKDREESRHVQWEAETFHCYTHALGNSVTGKHFKDLYLFTRKEILAMYCKVRKEGSEKRINYNSIFVKLHVFIYICVHRLYSGRKHTPG